MTEIKKNTEDQQNNDGLLQNANDDPYGTKKVQAYYLDFMDEFHRYCIRHKIRYSITGGTLLGAVRHKGFIPWDDDIDLMFDRKNYNRFMRTFEKTPMEGCEIIGSGFVKRITRKDNPLKDQEEQCLDIFILDQIPDNKYAAKFKALVIRLLQGMIKEKPDYERFSLPYKCMLFVTWLMGRPFSHETKYRLYMRVSQWGNRRDNHSGKISIYNTLFRMIGHLSFDEDIISGYIPMEFEGRKYMSIKGYHEFLLEHYGDYMTPPPEDQRVPMHMK